MLRTHLCRSIRPGQYSSLRARLCDVWWGAGARTAPLAGANISSLSLGPVRQAAAQGARRRGAGPAGAGVALGRGSKRGGAGRRHQSRCTPVPHAPP